jgi:hypothetical protein
MRFFGQILVSISLGLACSKGGLFGAGDGGVAKVVGEHCKPPDQVSRLIVFQVNSWLAEEYRNVTTYRDVAGDDGIVRRQEVRSCQLKTCIIYDGVRLGYTEAQAKAFVRERCGVFIP